LTDQPFGWPPVLSARLARQYCSISPRTLDRAVANGDLAVHGRRGGNGERTFKRSDLDRYLVGAAASRAQPRTRSSRDMRQCTSDALHNALERVAAITRAAAHRSFSKTNP
jgi:hypothetical protein